MYICIHIYAHIHPHIPFLFPSPFLSFYVCDYYQSPKVKPKLGGNSFATTTISMGSHYSCPGGATPMRSQNTSPS